MTQLYLQIINILNIFLINSAISIKELLECVMWIADLLNKLIHSTKADIISQPTILIHPPQNLVDFSPLSMNFCVFDAKNMGREKLII